MQSSIISSQYESGYDHGCDVAGIDDPNDYYINQDEKWASYHTAEFIDGYNDGFDECSSSGNDEEEYDSSEDDYVNQQSPQQYSSPSQEEDTLIEDFGQLVRCATTAPIASATGHLGLASAGLGFGL